MRRIVMTAAAAWMLVGAPALAQRIPLPGLPGPGGLPGLPAGMQDPTAMPALLEAAQAAARRPGDESLSCDDLQAKITEAMTDPALTAWTETAGVAAQRDLAAMQSAQAAVGVGQTATGIAGAFIPGADAAAIAAAAAQAQAAQPRAEERMQQQIQQFEQVTTIMPQLMRGQWLVELGGQKKCDWAAGEDFTSAFSISPFTQDDSQQ